MGSFARCSASDMTGTTGRLAEGGIFSRSPGLALRCPACAEALLRLTRALGHAWLDVCGLEYIELATLCRRWLGYFPASPTAQAGHRKRTPDRGQSGRATRRTPVRPD
jgi:hypothetical protein